MAQLGSRSVAGEDLLTEDKRTFAAPAVGAHRRRTHLNRIAELAEAAKVSTNIVTPRGRRCPEPRTVEAIQRALEVAGIEFIAENGGGPGARLRKGGAEAARAASHANAPSRPV